MYMPEGTYKTILGRKKHEQSTGRRLQDTHRSRTELLQSKAGREASKAYRPQRKMVQSRRRLDPLPEIQQSTSQLKTNEKIKNAKLCIPYNTSNTSITCTSDEA